jgi:hypothetical protein
MKEKMVRDLDGGKTLMPRFVMTAALVAALVTPALAAPALPTPPAASRWARPSHDYTGLPVHLASTSAPAPWFTSGVIAGRLGGVPVVGSYAGTSKIGIITLTAHGATFAFGGYTCFRNACHFTGHVAGVRVFRFPIPLNIRGAGTAIAHAFPNRMSWVTAVAGWATQHLSGRERDQAVAEAAAVPGS